MSPPDNSTDTAARFDPQLVEADGGFEVRTGRLALMVAPGVPLCVPNRGLAQALADEWRARGVQAKRDDLPLARLALAAAEVAQNRASVEKAVLEYSSTDLVCYWSSETDPKPLRDAQAAAWQPLLDWLAETHGARLQPVFGVAPVRQDDAALQRLQEVVAVCAPHELIALRIGTAASGSLVIGLALCAGALSPDKAYEAATVDEKFQMERWGRDEEAEQALAAKRAEIANAVHFLKLWRGESP